MSRWIILSFYGLWKFHCRNIFLFLEVVKGEYGHEKPVVCISCSRKLKNEEYILEITEEEIYIQYGSPAAAFYGMMTLNQLASGRLNRGHSITV